jgi:hypothetical protein
MNDWRLGDMLPSWPWELLKFGEGQALVTNMSRETERCHLPHAYVTPCSDKAMLNAPPQPI